MIKKNFTISLNRAILKEINFRLKWQQQSSPHNKKPRNSKKKNAHIFNHVFSLSGQTGSWTDIM